MPALPPFWEHATRGAAFGALVGGGVAVVGWAIRQRNQVAIDLGVPAAEVPRLLGGHRALAETLLHFKELSHHSATTQALYAQIVRDCEFVLEREAATGGAQVAVQKRVSQALLCAKRLAHEAFRHRDPRAHDCRMQVDELEAHLSSVQKNMMMGG